MISITNAWEGLIYAGNSNNEELHQDHAKV